MSSNRASRAAARQIQPRDGAGFKWVPAAGQPSRAAWARAAREGRLSVDPAGPVDGFFVGPGARQAAEASAKAAAEAVD